MPTYQYVCAKCGHEFDQLQSIKDKPLTVCPKELCPRKAWGKGRVKRLITAGGGLLFKGNGFYITDYRSENYKESAKKEATGTKPATTEAKAAGGDSKPATPKTESKPAKAETKKA